MNTTITANKKPTEESEKKKEAAKWTLEQEELLAEWVRKQHVIDGYIINLKNNIDVVIILSLYRLLFYQL